MRQVSRLAHGLAGSAAVVLMTLATTNDVISGLLSTLVFSVGSIMGMVMIGVTISGPVL